MFLKEAKASQNLLNVMNLINYKPIKHFAPETESDGQANDRSIRYHLIDFSLLPLPVEEIGHRDEN